MYEQFEWSDIARMRNTLLQQYEPVQPYVFVQLCSRFLPTFFFDIGANVGTYSMFMSRFECLKRIFAYEPSPMAYAELVKNVRLNDLEDRIVPKDLAVSDRNGAADFTVIGNYSGANHLASTPIQHVVCHDVISVQTRALDAQHVLAGERIAFKIDVEGHELGALAGARQLLSQNDVLLQVEIYGDAFDRVNALLQEAGVRYLFHIGADYYFASGTTPFSKSDIVDIIEQALPQMIQYSRSYGNREVTRTPPIKWTLVPGVSIELSGGSAERARNVRDSLGSLLGWTKTN